MRKKTLLKTLCGLLSLTLMVSSFFCFADDTEPITPQTDDLEPTPQTINISANYFDNGDSSYKIVFSSLDYLENLKNFGFTIEFTSATITGREFDSSMKNGDYTITDIGDNKLIFSKGSENTELSGKLILCSVTVTSQAELTADTVLFTDFTATNSEGMSISYAPTLVVSEGPVVPELSEKERDIYDAIIALPDVSAISFYKDDVILPLDDITKIITDTKSDYDALSDTEKTNINETLEYNMKDISKLTELSLIAEGIENTYDVVTLADIISDVNAEDLVKYNFATEKYTAIKESIDSSKLTDGSKVFDEYNFAKTLLEGKDTEITTAFSSLDYDQKYDTLKNEFEIIQTLSANKYYSDFITSILSRTEALRTDTDANYSGTDYYKNALLEEIDSLILDIRNVKNGFASLPTFEVGDIRRGMSYIVTLTRKATVAVEAKVRIVVKDKDGKKIDENTYNFKKGKTKLEASASASSTSYPASDDVLICVYYEISGAEMFIGDKTVYCKKESNTSTGPVGLPTTNKNDGKDDDKSGGTIFPSVPDDKDEDTKPAPAPENELFSDIGNHSWAKEAIEGLYYLGIINGMEDGIFNPAGNVTREQFCKMVVQLFEVLQYDTETDFVDVDSNAWYAQYINSAIRAGYVQGQSDEYFGIGESIMRQDMATILYRGLGTKNKAVELNFTDNDEIAPYAEDAIAELVGLGIFNGYEDGSFKPRGTATRAEAAKVIWGIYKIIHD